MVLRMKAVGAILLLAHIALWRAQQNRVVGMCFDVLLQILRPLKGLSAKVAFVRLQWNVNSHVRGDVIALDGSGAACAPSAGEIEVVCRLATDMALADMVLGSVSTLLIAA